MIYDNLTRPNTEYIFFVRAENSHGMSEPSQFTRYKTSLITLIHTILQNNHFAFTTPTHKSKRFYLNLGR